MNLNILSDFLVVDREKQVLIDNALYSEKKLYIIDETVDCCLREVDIVHPTKYCPQCMEKYTWDVNHCPDCLVMLKKISDKTPIRDIKTKPEFKFKAKNTYNNFEEVLTLDNINKINDFAFTIKDYDKIIRNIKKTSLNNMDNLIKEYDVDLDDISITDKILLYAKSFVNVEFKDYGTELGYFEFENIYLDDRLTHSFLITTIIHELAHFLIKEILTQVLCKLLDSNKNKYIEVIVTYILSYSSFTRLIDEYSAHCCEGRFTVYGYQDYSSFIKIIDEMEGELTMEEVEITKSIGNTFANTIKNILESFINDDLREEIKEDFMNNRLDQPDFKMLEHENCDKLTSEGFMKAIWLMLSEGFKVSSLNISKLEEYYEY